VLLHVQFPSFLLVSGHISDSSHIWSLHSSPRDKVHGLIIFCSLLWSDYILRTGEILHSTANFDGELKDGILKAGHVRCAAADTPDVHLATSGDDKVLKVWKINGLELLSSR
jgi:hypothetical protein